MSLKLQSSNAKSIQKNKTTVSRNLHNGRSRYASCGAPNSVNRE